jgi:hypothetical protein
MTPETFNTFIKVNKILNWKDHFHFMESIKTDSKQYWWTHSDGAKSGENFDTLEECHLSALIYFCNRFK